ncbi:hypothetical protein WDU94_006594 [Cyamophila willieti]
MSLKNNVCPGPDDIQTKTLKRISHFILTPLTHVINLSLEKGVFPNCFKEGIVIPLYKKGDPKRLPNYRPITILNNLSKILEKCVQTRLDFYLTANDILTHKQYGFRKRIGTEDAILDLTTYLHEQLDKGHKTLAVFLDITKAYDSIKHSILIQQLQKIGLTDNTLHWFQTYLSDRRQTVRLNSECSDSVICNDFSIPQGTILAPCLFNLYINDLPGKSQGEVFCYADDTVICYSAENWTCTHELAARDLTTIHDWYADMSLQINFDKTNYMTFSITDIGQPRDSRLELIDNNQQTITINRVSSVQYLGITLDSHLKWTLHTDKLKKKLRQLTYIFYSLRNICSRGTIREIYHALVQSLLQYCLVVWGGAYQNVMTTLQRTQNILLRTILNKDRLFTSTRLYEIFDVMDIHNLYIYKSAIFSIKKQTSWTINTNRYNTRQTGRTITQRTHKSLTQRHFSYIGRKCLMLYLIRSNVWELITYL